MFTWADLLLATGAAGVATVSVILVQLLKAGIPAVFDKVTGGTIVFVVTAVFYVIGGIVLQPDSNNALALFLSWITCAAAALGVHGVVNNGAATFVQGAPKDSGPPPA